MIPTRWGTGGRRVPRLVFSVCAVLAVGILSGCATPSVMYTQDPALASLSRIDAQDRLREALPAGLQGHVIGEAESGTFSFAVALSGRTCGLAIVDKFDSAASSVRVPVSDRDPTSTPSWSGSGISLGIASSVGADLGAVESTLYCGTEGIAVETTSEATMSVSGHLEASDSTPGHQLFVIAPSR